MRKRIVFLIDTLQRGGAETSLLEITSHFKKFEPVFIQLFKGDELKSEFDQKGIQVIQFDFDPSYRFHKVARAILPEIQRLNPLLIHSTLFRADMTARVLKSICQYRW